MKGVSQAPEPSFASEECLRSMKMAGLCLFYITMFIWLYDSRFQRKCGVDFSL